MSEGDRVSEIAELRRAVDSVRELAERLEELTAAGLDDAESDELPTRLLSAAEVSHWWGVGRRWVYNHAAELGARRLGEGPRPRLGFDAEELTERLGAPLSGRRETDRRRLTAIGRKPHSDSLSSPARATFAGQREHVAGRRADTSGPAAKDGEMRR